MKKKDVLPCMGRSFVGGTLLIQTYLAYQSGKMGSLIGLAASLIIFVVMNWSFCKSCCGDKSCDVAKTK